MQNISEPDGYFVSFIMDFNVPTYLNDAFSYSA